MQHDRPESYRKIKERYKEFLAKGWDRAELLCCALYRHGHHGLLLALRPGYDIGRIYPHVCELLGRPDGRGKRAILHHYRGGTFHDLRSSGLTPEEIVPQEARDWTWPVVKPQSNKQAQP